MIALTVGALAFPARAQQAAQKPPQLEVFAGYSYLRFDSKTIGFADNSNMHGWNAAVSYRFYKNLSAAADVSGNYASEIQLYNFLIGPQLAFPRGKNTFFGRVMVGKARDHVTVLGGDTSIGRAIAFGGGVDRELTSHFAFRLQIDYINTHTFGINESNVRASTGLVYRFGGR